MIPLFFINIVLAGAVGGLIGGQLGSGVGVGIAVLVGIALHFVPGILKRLADNAPTLKFDLAELPVQPPRKPILVLPALPKLTAPPCVGAFIAGIGPFFASFITERALPYTIGNAMLVLLIAGLFLGVQVALYTALIGVPVVLVTLMLLAVFSGPTGE